MARENPRLHRNERDDRAGLRAAHNSFTPVPLHELHGPLRRSAPTWCELALIAVAVMCVAPALVVGLLLLLEAVLPNANRCVSASVAINCTAEAADTTATP